MRKHLFFHRLQCRAPHKFLASANKSKALCRLYRDNGLYVTDSISGYTVWSDEVLFYYQYQSSAEGTNCS